jgi:hypothetical protein
MSADAGGEFGKSDLAAKDTHSDLFPCGHNRTGKIAITSKYWIHQQGYNLDSLLTLQKNCFQAAGYNCIYSIKFEKYVSL